MNKVILLSFMLFQGAYAMDIPGNSFGDGIFKDLSPMIRDYDEALKLTNGLQGRLNQAKDLTELEKLINSDKMFAVAPLKLNFSEKFSLQVTDDILQKFVALMPNLVGLDLSSCNKLTDVGIAHLKFLTNLRSLDLLGLAKLTDAGFEPLQSLKNLTSLNLGFTRMSDVGLEHIKYLYYLTTLKLIKTNITDAGLKYLESLDNLTILNLSQTNITDLRPLKDLDKLSELYLYGTKIWATGTGDIELAMPNCKIFR